MRRCVVLPRGGEAPFSREARRRFVCVASSISSDMHCVYRLISGTIPCRDKLGTPVWVVGGCGQEQWQRSRGQQQAADNDNGSGQQWKLRRLGGRRRNCRRWRQGEKSSMVNVEGKIVNTERRGRNHQQRRQREKPHTRVGSRGRAGFEVTAGKTRTARYIPVQQLTGTRTGRYRAVALGSAVDGRFTPRRRPRVLFSPRGSVSPRGREFEATSPRQRLHPGVARAALARCCPRVLFSRRGSVSPRGREFDYSYSGDTPRRSARIREKAKAVETPENEKPKKRERKSSSKKGAKEKKDDGIGLDETSGAKDDVTTGEAEAPTDVEMKESGVDVKMVENEGVAVEVAVNSDTDGKAVDEGAGEQDPVDDNGNAQEKTEPSLKKNDEEAAPEMEMNQADDKPPEAKVSPSAGNPEEASPGKEKQDREVSSGNISHKEDFNAVVSKDVPSANCSSDGEHPPGASPINS
ncbi:hypothetical protein BHE74_00056679 [Ensete ventricosum]|nr:hypothetical protein BHE74_00056679 [Ensete ventricosum]